MEVDKLRIYAACQDARVYAIQKLTGDVLWFSEPRLIDCTQLLRRGRMLHAFTQRGRVSMDVKVALPLCLFPAECCGTPLCLCGCVCAAATGRGGHPSPAL